MGSSGEKWCVVTEEMCKAVGPKSHPKSKMEPIRLGLYVRVLGGEKAKVHAFCDLFVSMNKLNIDIVSCCLGQTLSPAEWGEEFALLNDGVKEEEEEHDGKKALLSKFRAVATQGPVKRQRAAEME